MQWFMIVFLLSVIGLLVAVVGVALHIRRHRQGLKPRQSYDLPEENATVSAAALEVSGESTE
jgi:sensor histidine kinase regulating citrate/malate metabolism